MIDRRSLSLDWIKNIAQKTKSDPLLVEKVNRSLYLLELLQLTGIHFTFKGGTSLFLLFSEPKRFSIDLDILVENTDRKCLVLFDKIIEMSDFLRFEKDERTRNDEIELLHYKFYYETVLSKSYKEEYILLDIFFFDSPYGQCTMNIEIDSLFLMIQENPTSVNMPTAEALLGDKLSAFAPNTTGIEYGKGKEIEIIKQLYDIGNLFDKVKEAEVIGTVFDRVIISELRFRNKEHLGRNDVLDDIFDTSLLIATRGKEGKGEYSELELGIKNIRSYIFSESFHIEKAMIPAAKAAYISELIRAGKNGIARFEKQDMTEWMIGKPLSTRLNKLKKTSPEAFFYWFQIYLIRQHA